MRDTRIRELELELARTKLAQVEVECKNQVRVALSPGSRRKRLVRDWPSARFFLALFNWMC